MRLFRRARDTKKSVIRREGVSATAEAPSVPPPSVSRSSSPVAPIVVEAAAPVFRPHEDMGTLHIPPPAPSYDGLEDSDVFVCKHGEGGAQLSTEVTLYVHGWHNVEPGLLSWTFPNLRAALDAVKRMRNAIGWCVVSGSGWNDLESARAGGAVLVEQLA